GLPQRPWLGADLQSLTPEIAATMSVDAPQGVLVASVADNGPAYDAGLKIGDLIVSMDDSPIDDLGAFNYRLATRQLGGSTKLEVVREGKRYTATLALVAAPETVPRDERRIEGDSPFAGLT